MADEPAQSSFEIQDKTISYKCPRFSVEETTYLNSAKELRKTYTLTVPSDVLIIIPRLQEKIFLLSAETPPYPKVQYLFPSGFLSPGIPLADTALAILIESLGVTAQKFIYIGKFRPNRYIMFDAHVMVADGLQRLKEKSDLLKDKILVKTEKEIADLLIDRHLDDGLTLAAYTYYVTSQHYWTEVHQDPVTKKKVIKPGTSKTGTVKTLNRNSNPVTL